MSTPSPKAVIKAFSEIMREKLENGETVTVPGLGTFSIEHQPSEMTTDDDGETYMKPPRNLVSFDPEQ